MGHPARDPRDARDLEVLAQREDKLSLREISRRVRAPIEIVEAIIVNDALEFPDEPLGRRAP